jgi:calmodulin
MRKAAPTKNEPTMEQKVAETTEERHQEIRELFKIFDRDGNNKISADEVSSLLFSLGRPTTPMEVKKLISEVDKDKNGTLELEEFIQYLDKTFVLPQSKVEEVVEAFKVFDQDNNGTVSKDEFANILMRFGGDFTEEEVAQIFSEVDVNADGKLNYAEFVELWKYQ